MMTAAPWPVLSLVTFLPLVGAAFILFTRGDEEVVARNARNVALWKGGDGAVIDGLGPDGISAVTRDIAGRASRLQSGYVYHYAFVMLLGVAGLLTYALFQFRG